MTALAWGQSSVVKVEGGMIQGVPSSASGVTVFRGIPYAAPPVGDLRWKHPQPVVKWKGVKVADTFSNICWQPGNAVGTFYGNEFYWKEQTVQSEDCLYLNVWAPADAVGNPAGKLPVAFWVHGGAYFNGYGHEITMDGDAWAKRGVILVTINYRLGIFGFLAHPELSAENPDGISDNYGTYDQVAALKWVHDNIAQFGGDPDNITVLGQSAGAASIKNLVSSPLSKGLIKNAIIQSGGGIGAFGNSENGQKQVEATGKAFMDKFGYNSLKAMRAVPAERLLEIFKAEGMNLFRPHIDGILLTESFDDAARNQHLADANYMIGCTLDDIRPMGKQIDEFCFLRDSLDHRPAYQYLFARKLPGTHDGAFHSAELWYMFHTLDRSWCPMTEADYKLADEVMDCWTNFVKYGNPNGRSSESRQARLDGRVVTDEGEANQPGSESWAPFTLGNPYVKTLNVKPAQGYQSRLLSHEAEIDNIINGMTLEEKIDMLHGKNMFSSAGIPRLGITDVEYADGPFGIREEMEPHSWNSAHLTTDSATFFPTGSALAATWSTEWAYAYGRGMSREARLRGKDMILGPAINIQRIPTGGRTYEYLSEDPILSGMLAVAYTKGSQDDGTAVCLKHYALNNQEDYRGFVDVRISDRAMHEIYLRPFEMAVREADAWGVMAAYNKVNGHWCSENETLLTTILRQQWGFPGMVISDWGGVHSTVDAVTAGMNVEMPGSRFMGQALLDSVKAGKVSEAVINQRVREILRVRLTVRPIAKDVANTKPVGNAEEMTTALEVARRSIVLLKNEKVLPIDTKKVKRIAVIGENAVTKMALGGVGAGVKTRCEITPLEGLKSILGNQVEITYVPGYKSYDRDSRNKHLNPIQPADRELMAQAVETAKNADLVIFFAGDNREVETEGSDRKSVTLPSGQDELAVALAKANKRLVTVIVSGGPVDVSTMSEVSGALVASWFNGSMGGQALAEVLTGKISPSGKLPMTWPKRLEDVPAYATGTYPQTIENNSQGDIFVDLTRNRSNERRQQLIADYAEQDLVGYRWYEQKHVAPAYPFGYGLSYATFEYSNLNVKHTADSFDVSFTLTNTSDRDAEEVAQVYISRLIKELKGFRRVALKAGERKVITIPIRRSDLCHWDEATQAWRLEPDDITILVGGSSDNLPLTSKNEIK